MLSIVDIIVIAILAAAFVIGFFKGILKSLLRFAEVIVTLGLAFLAGMCTVWFGLVNLEAIQQDFMGSGALFFIVAFFVVFILSVVVCDFAINKIIYGKRKFKSVMTDRLLGAFINLIVWVFIMFVIFGIVSALEGTEYDFYMALTDGSVVTQFLIDYNPLRGLLTDLFVENGIVKIIVEIFNMVWPNFEYFN